jgi:hypothetical protein
MLKIEHRVALSAGFKSRLKVWRAKYYATIAENVERHKCHREGDCKCGWIWDVLLGLRGGIHLRHKRSVWNEKARGGC